MKTGISPFEVMDVTSFFLKLLKLAKLSLRSKLTTLPYADIVYRSKVSSLTSLTSLTS